MTRQSTRVTVHRDSCQTRMINFGLIIVSLFGYSSKTGYYQLSCISVICHKAMSNGRRLACQYQVPNRMVHFSAARGTKNGEWIPYCVPDIYHKARRMFVLFPKNHKVTKVRFAIKCIHGGCESFGETCSLKTPQKVDSVYETTCTAADDFVYCDLIMTVHPRCSNYSPPLYRVTISYTIDNDTFTLFSWRTTPKRSHKWESARKTVTKNQKAEFIVSLPSKKPKIITEDQLYQLQTNSIDRQLSREEKKIVHEITEKSVTPTPPRPPLHVQNTNTPSYTPQIEPLFAELGDLAIHIK